MKTTGSMNFRSFRKRVTGFKVKIKRDSITVVDWISGNARERMVRGTCGGMQL